MSTAADSAKSGALGADHERVVAVVVAYNRRVLLAETLAALASQSRPVDVVIVVDNASSDGSADAARQALPTADVISLNRNTGGAGGFTVGIERAVTRHRADLVWVMDDDTVPSASALEQMLVVRAKVPAARLLASRVVWTDGRDHPMNTPRRRVLLRRRTRRMLSDVVAYPFRSASFVSLLIPVRGVAARGLPVADYFLWNDDFEYSTRLVRGGIGVLCERSIVEHRTRVFSGIEVDPGERFYFEVRNKLWLFRYSSSLDAVEKPIYVLASLLRWVQVFRRSRDRATLRKALVRGLRDALAAEPRSNAESLGGLGDVTASVAAFEERLRG